jgi:hypothetical protein
MFKPQVSPESPEVERSMSSLSYCKGWFRATKSSLAPYSIERAWARHDAGEIYCALVGSVEAPHAVLEIAKGMVDVSFLDENLRDYIRYSFHEMEPGRLFLTRATWREFVGASDQIANCTTYSFRSTGDTNIYGETFVPSHFLAYSESHSDVSGNWSETPSFGHYGDLLRVDRINADNAFKQYLLRGPA